jgi:hypothetical protein
MLIKPQHSSATQRHQQMGRKRNGAERNRHQRARVRLAMLLPRRQTPHPRYGLSRGHSSIS